ncbi:hypothetical protein AA313_de0200835 [Arthrobotrys entomopaga]|nr:hypothetical protein AA313_de0200835 [Arthrobotrys entomopaga]
MFDMAFINLSGILIILLLGSASYFICLAFYNLFLHPARSFPGPLICRISPLGQLYYAAGGKRYLWLHSLHKKYGTHVRIAPSYISINTVPALHTIYGHSKQIQKSKFFTVFPAIKTSPSVHSAIDKGIHSRKRRILSQAFSEVALRGVEDLILDCCRLFQQQIVEAPKEYGENTLNSRENQKYSSIVVRDMTNWFNSFSFDVLGSLCFGKPFGLMEGHGDKAMYKETELTVCRNFLCGLWTPLSDLKLDEIFLRQMAQSRREFTNKTRAYVAVRAKERAENPQKTRKDFFYYLLDAVDPETGEKLSLKELWSESSLLVAAGADTTSSSLAATVFWLLRRPKALSKLQTEIRDTFQYLEDIVHGSDPKLRNCTYLNAVINESMRISPAVPGDTPREILPGGLVIDGKFIPGGTDVGTPIYSIHRDLEAYPCPDEFLPERWIEGEYTPQIGTTTRESIEKAKKAFCPFSIGPRAFLPAERGLRETGENSKGEWDVLDYMLTLKKGPIVELRQRKM